MNCNENFFFFWTSSFGVVLKILTCVNSVAIEFYVLIIIRQVFKKKKKEEDANTLKLDGFCIVKYAIIYKVRE